MKEIITIVYTFNGEEITTQNDFENLDNVFNSLNTAEILSITSGSFTNG